MRYRDRWHSGLRSRSLVDVGSCSCFVDVSRQIRTIELRGRLWLLCLAVPSSARGFSQPRSVEGKPVSSVMPVPIGTFMRQCAACRDNDSHCFHERSLSQQRREQGSGIISRLTRPLTSENLLKFDAEKVRHRWPKLPELPLRTAGSAGTETVGRSGSYEYTGHITRTRSSKADGGFTLRN
jgi:hypothetical protein